MAIGSGAVVLSLIGFVAVFLATARARDGYKDRCPKCNSIRVRPSWRKFRDTVLAGLAIGPFRCEACKKRFYARISSQS